MVHSRGSRRSPSQGAFLGWLIMIVVGVLLLATAVLLYLETQMFAWSLLVALGVLAVALLGPALELAKGR